MELQTPKTWTAKIPDLVLLDDWINYHDREAYDRRWNARCSDCLAPCCNLNMTGYLYDYKKSDNINVKEMSEFWSNDFVIMMIRYQSFEEFNEMGFKVNTGIDDLNKLHVCPLNILGDCLIYEDRPLMCKEFRCEMALDTYFGVN